VTYPAELVSLKLFRLSPPETSLVNQIGQFLLHELLDLRNGLLEAGLGCASYMKIQRGVRRCSHGLVRII
jgi:hypothetical protein